MKATKLSIGVNKHKKNSKIKPKTTVSDQQPTKGRGEGITIHSSNKTLRAEI